jgi:hypothetical protein
MIWVSICYVAQVGVSALQPMIHFEISLQPSHRKVEFMYKERLLAFSHAIHEDEWILSSLKMVFKHWRMLSFVITNSTCTNLVQYASTTITHVATVAVQNKAQSYAK